VCPDFTLDTIMNDYRVSSVKGSLLCPPPNGNQTETVDEYAIALDDTTPVNLTNNPQRERKESNLLDQRQKEKKQTYGPAIMAAKNEITEIYVQEKNMVMKCGRLQGIVTDVTHHRNLPVLSRSYCENDSEKSIL